jgi:hypothetical protein
VRLAADLGASARAQRNVALLLAFTPIIWLISAVWGQVDSVGTTLLLFATSELIRGKTLRAAALAALAAVIKPQFGILIPLLALIALIRARRSGDRWAVVLTGLVGTAVVSLVALPFGLTVVDVIGKVGEAAGNYPYLSVNAWNPWALVSTEGSGLLLNGPLWRHTPHWSHPCGALGGAERRQGAHRCCADAHRHRLLCAANTRARAVPLPSDPTHPCTRRGTTALATDRRRRLNRLPDEQLGSADP